MNIPDETLMAYADDELEAPQRAEVDAAIAADPTLATRIEQHRAVRNRLNAAFDPVLMETVPNTLVATVHTAPAVAAAATPGATPGAMSGAASGATSAAASGATAERAATVTDLRRVRAARAAEAKGAAALARRTEVPRRPWTWFEWGAMAASVGAGAVIAHLALRSPDTDYIGTEGGRLVAQADLSQALSTQLASTQPADSPVQIGVSFKSKAGDTCRTFTLKERNVLGGLACHEGGEWHVQLLASAPAGTTGPGGYKPAGDGMPASVLTAVEQQIAGEPFDATAEAAALARGWK